jgi:putative FmdB family regulatory protein
MPTYEYKCRACAHRFEVSQRITEDSLTECPECHGEIRRVLFPAGVVFKGSGWYVTDYRDSGEKAKYDSDTKGEPASGATAESKETKPSDAKPADAKSAPATETKSQTPTESKPKPSEPAKAA